MPVEAILVLAILVGGVALFISEKYPIDLVALRHKAPVVLAILVVVVGLVLDILPILVTAILGCLALVCEGETVESVPQANS